MASYGELEVLVLCATQLKVVQTFGRQDPYVMLELAGQKYQTRSKTDAGTKPVWNERFNFIQINTNYATEMIVRVVDRNMVTSDVLIGQARLPLSKVYASRIPEEVRLQLATDKGRTAGELQLLLTFKPDVAAPTTPMPPHPMMQPAATVMVSTSPAPMYHSAPAPAPAPAYNQPTAPAPAYNQAPAPGPAPAYNSAPAPAYNPAPAPAPAPVYSAPPAMPPPAAPYQPPFSPFPFPLPPLTSFSIQPAPVNPPSNPFPPQQQWHTPFGGGLGFTGPSAPYPPTDFYSPAF